MTVHPSRHRSFGVLSFVLPTPLGRAAALCALLLATPAAAEWTGGVEGDVVSRDGENVTRVRLRLSENTRPLTQSLFAEWSNYEGGSGYRAGYLPRYWLDERLYLFGEAQLRVDRPLRIDRGAFAVAGAGYRLYDGEDGGLGVELGAGGRSTRFEPLPGQSEGEEQDEGLVLARLSGYQRLADALRVELDAELLQGSSLGEQRLEAAVAYRVPGGALRLGVRYVRLDPEDGDAIDDTQTSVGFVYGF